jgi:hypothetical protein
VPTVKRIVCLANSRKLKRYCVAGKEWSVDGPGRWIRPVSSKPQGELEIWQMAYRGGGLPHVLDIVDVPLQRPVPKDYQQENWLLSSERWEHRGRIGWQDLAAFADPEEPLWCAGGSTKFGHHDEIPLDEAKRLTSSLRLIRVEALQLRVADFGFDEMRRRVQGRFHFAGSEYRLWVTDPDYERTYFQKPDGIYDLDTCYLTISISEPYEKRNACYKLIAAIIQRSGASP